MTKSVSSYRSGSPRFGIRDSGPIHSEVKTYTLPPEELEKYRNGADTKMAGKAGKGDLEEAKRLIKETDLSANEIVERTGANKLTVKTYMQKMRFNKDSKNKKEQAPKINNLPKEGEANVTVVADYKQLMKDHEELKQKVQEIQKDRNELDSELKRVEKELESKNDELVSLAAEFKALQELNCEPVKEEPVQETLENENKFLRDSNNHLHQENLELRIRARVYKEAMSELLKEKG